MKTWPKRLLVTATVSLLAGGLLTGFGVVSGAQKEFNRLSTPHQQDLVTQSQEFTELKGFELSSSHRNLFIKESKDTNFHLTYQIDKKNHQPNATANGQFLSFHDPDFLNSENSENIVTTPFSAMLGYARDSHPLDVTLEVPKGKSLEQLDALITHGDIRLENLTASVQELHTSYGQIQISHSHISSIDQDPTDDSFYGYMTALSDIILNHSSFNYLTLISFKENIQGTNNSFSGESRINAEKDINLSLRKDNLQELNLDLYYSSSHVQLPNHQTLKEGKLPQVKKGKYYQNHYPGTSHYQAPHPKGTLTLEGGEIHLSEMP